MVVYLSHWKCKQIPWESKPLRLDNVHVGQEEGVGMKGRRMVHDRLEGADLEQHLEVMSSLFSEEQIDVIDGLWGLK